MELKFVIYSYLCIILIIHVVAELISRLILVYITWLVRWYLVETNLSLFLLNTDYRLRMNGHWLCDESGVFISGRKSILRCTR